MISNNGLPLLTKIKALSFTGLNNSGEEELGHWNDMRESKGEQVCRWHVLLES